MSEIPQRKPGRPTHLWVVGVLALLWNSLVAFEFLMIQTRSGALMVKFSPDHVEYFHLLPLWIDGAWLVAVLCAFFGSILLLLGKQISVWILLVSLLCLVPITIYSYGISSGLGPGKDSFGLVFSGLVFLFSMALNLYARAEAERGVLR